MIGITLSVSPGLLTVVGVLKRRYIARRGRAVYIENA